MPLDPPHAVPPERSSLVLCLKAPPRSKRRLVSSLGEQAAVIAAHLLDCALEDLAAWPGPVVLAPAAALDAAWLRSAVPAAYDTIVQRGHSLGDRINYIDAALRARGHRQLIYIGTDCPALDGGYLHAAAAALADADGVLGPASDGGVVLMGSRRPWPPLGDLGWSTRSLHDDLARRLRAHDWTLAALGTRADVDELADLDAAAAQLATDARPARRALLGWLRQWRHEPAAAT